jgi:hypothetical protein
MERLVRESMKSTLPLDWRAKPSRRMPMPSEIISPTLSLDTKPARVSGRPHICRLGCCGISEIIFEHMQNTCLWSRWTDLQWRRAISDAIKQSASDKRLLVVGIPTVVRAGSQYDIEFYRKVRKTLLSLGFQETKPYKNKGSGNTIVAMIGQVP